MQVAIADNNAVFRAGLRSYLRPFENNGGFIEFSSFSEILDFRASPQGVIDLLIVSLGLPGLDKFLGIQTLCKLLDGIPVIVISAEAKRQSGVNALQAGARAYILNSAPGETVLRAARRVLAGEIVILIEPDTPPNAPQAVDTGCDLVNEIDGGMVYALTDRQTEVLEILAAGKSNAEIALELGISVHTARLHVSAILKALNLASRTQAALAGRHLLGKLRRNTQ